MTIYEFTFNFLGVRRGTDEPKHKIMCTTLAEQTADALLRLHDEYEQIEHITVIKEKIKEEK